MLNLARLTGWKGQRVLIEAAALPPLAGRDDVVVVLAGDEQGRDGYRARAGAADRGARACGRVRIVGHCDDVPAALALADVAVIASTEPEAFGRTAVEAEAMGVPVVATALGAAPETVLAPPDVAAARAHRLAASRPAMPQRSPRRSARRWRFRRPSGGARRRARARARRSVSRSRRCRRRRSPLYDRLLARRPRRTASRNG